MEPALALGFETIGNATLIAYDRIPVLVTDPWLSGSAYFGSWGLSHEIPSAQRDAIAKCSFVWLSHGHPDHLDAASLPLLAGKQILLPDHVGGRIANELQAAGHQVTILKDRQWFKLSDKIRIVCIADYNQDAVLLIDIGGRLVIDTNDASDRGWGRFVRKVAASFPISFLLAISGYGDADMINFVDRDGDRIIPAAARKNPVGRVIARKTEAFGVRYFIPFSSMHRYQRTDSIWANEYVTELEDYGRGFDSKQSKLLPAFIRYDCTSDRWVELHPDVSSLHLLTPQECGDDWSEPLERGDIEKIQNYFRPIEHLYSFLDFIQFSVGGTSASVSFRSRDLNRGIVFEVPRHSLMKAVEYEVFDDLLIGNFMRTTLHGTWKEPFLYPDFNPVVPKYADNGRAKSQGEVDEYFAEYRRRAPYDYIRHRLVASLTTSPSGLRLYEAAAHVKRRFRGIVRRA